MFTTDTAKNIVAAFKDDEIVLADETLGDTVNKRYQFTYQLVATHVYVILVT